MEGLNSGVENRNDRVEQCMGREEENILNNNGEWIIELSIENNVLTANRKFKHKPTRKLESITTRNLISSYKQKRKKNNKRQQRSRNRK